MRSPAPLCIQRDNAVKNTGVPKNAIEKKRSLSTVPRKNGSPATYDIINPFQPRGYICGHAAHTAKLLIRKNETELASAAPITRAGPEFSRRFVPSQSMAAYQAKVTRVSHDRA